MKVIQNLVPVKKYNLKCPYPMVAQFYVVHNTANDATAINEIKYMNSNSNQTSFHYAIDDINIVQGVPEHRNAWHAGDGGQGAGNRRGIGIEICFSKSGGQRFMNAEKRAAKFIAFGLKEKGWDLSHVKKHQDFSGKNCPHRTLSLGWKRFLDMIQVELNLLNSPVQVKPPVVNVNTPSSWAVEHWDWAKTNGVTDGTRPKDGLSREEFVVMLKRIHDK